MNINVSIIILNWNGCKDTIECLKSLKQSKNIDFNVIIVDNGSEDNSIQKINEFCVYNKIQFFSFFTEEITNKNQTFKAENFDLSYQNSLLLIESKENLGYARGNNIGIKFAFEFLDSNYILLLNNDTFVEKNFFVELKKEIYLNNDIGIFSPKILNAYNNKLIDSTGHIKKFGRIVDRGHGKMDNNQFDDKLEVWGAMGAAALYKKEMIDDIGYLNEEYVTLYEDAEFSWRAHKLGWKSRFVPYSIIYHKRGKSIKKKVILPKMIHLSIRNTVNTVKKYGSFIDKFLYSFILLRSILFVIYGKIFRKNNISILNYFKLVFKYYYKLFN